MSLLSSDDEDLTEGSPLLLDADLAPSPAAMSHHRLSTDSRPLLPVPPESFRRLSQRLNMDEISKSQTITDLDSVSLHSNRRSRTPDAEEKSPSSSHHRHNGLTRFDSNSNVVNGSTNKPSRKGSVSSDTNHVQQSTTLHFSERELSLCSLTPASTTLTVSPSVCTVSFSDELSLANKSIITQISNNHKKTNGKGLFASRTKGSSSEQTQLLNGGDKPAKKKRLKMFTKRKPKDSLSDKSSDSPQSSSPLRVIM